MFDKNADGSNFTFRPILSNNLLQITRNDDTNICSFTSSGNMIVHQDIITETGLSLSSINENLGNKASTGHTHDDRYYTKSEISNGLITKNIFLNTNQFTYPCSLGGAFLGIASNTGGLGFIFWGVRQPNGYIAVNIISSYGCQPSVIANNEQGTVVFNDAFTWIMLISNL